MVSNLDLQIWQDAVNGINDSGKIELTQEEWTALTALNVSLSNGNVQTDEIRHFIKLLKDNLSKHFYNPILHTHLQNFINLCEQYLYTVTNSSPVSSVAGNTSNQPVNTSGNVRKDSRKGSRIMLLVIIVAVVFLTGYAIVKNSDNFSSFFSVCGFRSYPPTISVISPHHVS